LASSEVSDTTDVANEEHDYFSFGGVIPIVADPVEESGVGDELIESGAGLESGLAMTLSTAATPVYSYPPLRRSPVGQSLLLFLLPKDESASVTGRTGKRWLR
jgi:hypothetical protein